MTHLSVPLELIKSTPNDLNLGEKVRILYYEQIENKSMVYVTVYYNDVSFDPPIVRENCPSVKLPIEDARRIADKMVADGNWARYLIPELEPFQIQIDQI